MIAMQYSFTLPADYDMSIVHTRIASKGHLTDTFPDLLFKAYLSATIHDEKLGSHENLYAPFYVWHREAGLNAFINSPAFQGLVHDFGWPAVKTWFIWEKTLSPAFQSAHYATREIITLPSHTNLQQKRQKEIEWMQHEVQHHSALGTVVAFEPTTWTLVRFSLWSSDDAFPIVTGSPEIQRYQVGYLSVPVK